MPFFCQDADLLAWEPALFVEDVFAHQALLSAAAGTLAGTTLTLSAASFVDAGVSAGMVAQLTNADASLTQLVEIAAVVSATSATISSSVLRYTRDGTGLSMATESRFQSTSGGWYQ